MTASIEAMALQACNDGDTWHDFDSPEWRARFAALVRAQAESEAHAAIDASEAKIVRNRLDGYPGREDHVLTLVERIEALSKYAADWKRWCMEAEESAASARAQALEQAAERCEESAQRWPGSIEKHYVAHECAASIRALPPLE